MNIEQIQISKFSNALSKSPISSTVLSELLAIKSGKHKAEIDKCRYYLANGQKAEYSRLKGNLPAVAFSGRFEAGRRRENLVEYTNLIVIDIDQLPVLEIDLIKEKLFQDAHIFACWKSPSGIGIKALLKTSCSADQHKYVFDSIADYFFENHDLVVDKSGSDITRLCYVSFDDDLKFRESSEIFTTLKIPLEKTRAARSSPDSEDHKIFKQLTISEIERIHFCQTEGRNSAYDREKMWTIIRFLTKTKRSITSTYNDWFQVALAISNSFTYEIGERYFIELCRMDGENYNEYKCHQLLQYCYRNRRAGEVTFAKIIYLAGLQGFDLKYRKNITSKK